MRTVDFIIAIKNVKSGQRKVVNYATDANTFNIIQESKSLLDSFQKEHSDWINKVSESNPFEVHVIHPIYNKIRSKILFESSEELLAAIIFCTFMYIKKYTNVIVLPNCGPKDIYDSVKAKIKIPSNISCSDYVNDVADLSDITDDITDDTLILILNGRVRSITYFTKGESGRDAIMNMFDWYNEMSQPGVLKIMFAGYEVEEKFKSYDEDFDNIMDTINTIVNDNKPDKSPMSDDDFMKVLIKNSIDKMTQ